MSPRSRRRPTIRDVAERAGVSKSLVSLVMRGAPNVSEERREAVLRAAEELGYRPNVAARILRRRARVLGVMAHDLHNPFHAEIIDGVQAAAAEDGYRVLVAAGRQEEAVSTLLELPVDGMVLTGTTLSAARIDEAAREVPVALVGRTSRNPAVDTVVDDDRRGAELVAEHLAGLGHRRVAQIHGGRGPGAALRRSGFRRAAERLGMSVVELAGNFTEESGRRATERLLAAEELPTAIFAANDATAVGVLEILDGAGIPVPDRVSVVGYDNTALAALHRISLTTVDQPRQEMGVTAARLLVGRLAGRTAPRRIVLPPSLVIRETTGPPP